jgi:hypothetical protein
MPVASVAGMCGQSLEPRSIELRGAPRQFSCLAGRIYPQNRNRKQEVL